MSVACKKHVLILHRPIRARASRRRAGVSVKAARQLRSQARQEDLNGVIEVATTCVGSPRTKGEPELHYCPPVDRSTGHPSRAAGGRLSGTASISLEKRPIWRVKIKLPSTWWPGRRTSLGASPVRPVHRGCRAGPRPLWRSGDWHWVRRLLEDADVHVITPDLPPHSTPTAGLAEDADEVRDAIRACAPPLRAGLRTGGHHHAGNVKPR
jgi:hypothetical protein